MNNGIVSVNNSMFGYRLGAEPPALIRETIEYNFRLICSRRCYPVDRNSPTKTAAFAAKSNAYPSVNYRSIPGYYNSPIY